MKIKEIVFDVLTGEKIIKEKEIEENIEDEPIKIEPTLEEKINNVIEKINKIEELLRNLKLIE